MTEGNEVGWGERWLEKPWGYPSVPRGWGSGDGDDGVSMVFVWHGFYIEHKDGFGSAVVVDWERDGLAEACAVLFVVVLCPSWLGGVPLGRVGYWGEGGVCEGEGAMAVGMGGE